MKKEKFIKISPDELFIQKVVSEWYDIQKLLVQLNRPLNIIVEDEERDNGWKQVEIHKQK